LEDFDRDVRAAAHRGAMARAQLELAQDGLAHRQGEEGMQTSLRRDAFWNRRTAGHYDRAARFADMDRDGVTASVLFHGSQNGNVIPFVDFEANFDGQLPEPSRQPLEAEGRRIYNRWLSDFCSEDPERHVALCQVPIWDMRAAVKEVVWASERGFKGVHFPANVDGIPTFEDPVWEPFFAVCAERNMVLTTHISGAEQLFPPYTGRGAWGIRAMESTWLGRRAMWLLTFSGVFDRHPRLKFVLTELPGSWWADTAREMDAAYFSLQGRRTLQGFLQRKPSEYVSTNMWWGASFLSRREVMSALESGAADRVMWGSDYPHTEGTWLYSEEPAELPVTRLSLANTFHDLDEDAIVKMVGQNAVECYGLDRDALMRTADRIGPRLSEIATEPDLSLVPQRYEGCGFREHGAWS
jgi:predicted TIM-barrel fold metal-dependent hydrolase